MKSLRKNLDLDSKTVAVLQIEATLKNYGTLKPFLEQILQDHAEKCMRARPGVYKEILEKNLNAPSKHQAKRTIKIAMKRK